MENLNNVEEIMETVDTAEVLESIGPKGAESIGFVIGAALAAGLIAGGYGVKKLWDKRQAKKTASEMETVEADIVEDSNETEEN